MKPDTTNPLALMAERKIRDAMDQGLFDNLPGRGRPQKLEDLSRLPDDLRLAYIVLNNGGYLEEDAKKDMPPSSLMDMLSRSSEEARTSGRIERARFLLNRSRRNAAEPDWSASDDLPPALSNPEYLEKVLKKVGGKE